LLTPCIAYNEVTNPAIGAFIYRGANGIGTFIAPNMQLKWNYGSNGVSSTDLIEIKVFAIEML
jgi:hypothetical protein